MGSIILVKHALPELVFTRPPRQWEMGEKGRDQASALAKRLLARNLSAVYSSVEPKAAQTAAIIARAVARPVVFRNGLHEYDRRPQRGMSPDELADVNRAVFDRPDEAVLGMESANSAKERFMTAIDGIVSESDPESTLVVVSHGTVISLLVAARNNLDPFSLWRRLACPSYVELARPGFTLVEVCENAMTDVNETGRSW